jgi:hypothetical protein
MTENNHKISRKVSTDSPISEITIRKYEKPYDVSKRDLIKKLCLSLGLLQPGDSRDIIVDVLYCLLESKRNDSMMSSEEVRSWVLDYRKGQNLDMVGAASSNIRRQIKRLRDHFLVEKVANNYRINENMRLSDIFDEKIKDMLIPSIISRIKEYIFEVDNQFFPANKTSPIKPIE